MRVLLPKEIQRKLLFDVKSNFHYTWKQLAVCLGVSGRSLENWYRCERLLPEGIYKTLLDDSRLVIDNVKFLPDNWGLVKGGNASFLKYGSFWTLEGSKKGGINSSRKFPLPEYSKNLAEFIGIMLGDGGMSRGQISITLGYSTDYKYVPYIKRLVKKLFAIDISISYPPDEDAVKIRVSGVNLVRNLCNLGLVQGDKIKQQINIPSWIFKEESYMKFCVRGLIDTDGCVHRKTRREKNGFEYRSVGITFCSASKPLRESLMRIFSILGFKVAISNRIIYLCGKEQIYRYVAEIGFSNPKHLSRYKSFLQDYGWKKSITV